MNTYIYIGIAIIIALLSTRLMKLIKLPNVTGYLLTGILVGPYVLGLFFNGFKFNSADIAASNIGQIVNNLGFISEIALAFIAFTIGSSFNIKSIKKVGKKVLSITFFEAFGACLFVFLFLMIAHFIYGAINKGSVNQISWPLILTLAAISCATAPAATLLVIKQYKAKGPVTETLLPVVALDDAVALILFSVLFSIAKTIETGNGVINLYEMLAKPVIEIVLSLAIGAVLGFLISLLFNLFKSRANRMGLCIFALFLNLGLSILFKKDFMGNFDLSSLLMCMVTGAILINFRKDSILTFNRIDEITPPIFMLFFILSGANLDLTVFASDNNIILLIIALTYVISRVIGKYCGSLFGATITKAEPEVKKYLGLTLIPQAGVAIGLATSASKSLSSTDSSLGTLIIATILTSTIIYELVGPAVTKFALSKAKEIELPSRK